MGHLLEGGAPSPPGWGWMGLIDRGEFVSRHGCRRLLAVVVSPVTISPTAAPRRRRRAALQARWQRLTGNVGEVKQSENG